MTVKELITRLSNIPLYLEVELDVTPENIEEPVFVRLESIVYDTKTVTLG